MLEVGGAQGTERGGGGGSEGVTKAGPNNAFGLGMGQTEGGGDTTGPEWGGKRMEEFG